MAGRYTAEFLLHLRGSPLCVKPHGLPPAEDWMGPPPETFRTQSKTTTDRMKTGTAGDSLLLSQENRRPPLDRNGTRGASNPDDIILGPPRSTFASATSARNNRNAGDADKGLKEPERQDRTSDRFNFRNRAIDSDATAGDRFRDRDSRGTFRRRGDQDQDSEGWSTVKPRKSFGTEGAERFHGRIGGAGECFGGRDDRRARDRDDRDGNDRRNRNLDKDGDDADGARRNGLARGKSEPWFRDNNDNGGNDAPISQRERIDKAKSWRDRDPEAIDKRGDRPSDRNYDRRWDRDRDQRVERDPEWLDEPLEEKSQGHTEEDFKRFMESMKAKQGGGATKPEEKPSTSTEKSIADNGPEPDLAVAPVPAVDTGPDKFFVAFGAGTLPAAAPAADNKDTGRQKGAKGSRFMAFLTPQDEGKARTEPPTPAAAAQAGASGSSPEAPVQTEAEKEAFALLIQKLHRSGIGPAVQASGPPPQSLTRLFEQGPAQELQPKSAVASPEPFQQYGGDPREDPRLRAPPQHPIHNMISPRQMVPPTQPPPVSRPEQALQDLLAQRHNLNTQANRAAQNATAVNNNTEFLMRLMQSHREGAEPPRPELLMRMPQPTKQVSLANIPDREQEYQRERSASQRQQQQQHMRVQQGLPPGFLEEPFHPPEMDSRPQPTQILQRPPPPGLDHHGMHPFPMGAANAGAASGQMPPPQQRPMIPPPGLPRNVNMPPPGMYPPAFAPQGPVFGGPPPPEGMGGVGVPQGPLARGMHPPPGFYGGHPPPGFMPPPGMSPGFQGGPEGPGGFPGGAGVPFDRRGMLPPGGFRGP